MPRISVLVATPSNACFARLGDLLLGRPEFRLVPYGVGDGRVLPEARRESVDILLVDGDGFGERAMGFVRRVAALGLPTRTLLLHSLPNDARVAHVLRLGGAGCLPSACNAYLLIRAIEAVHAGELWASRKALAEALRKLRVPLEFESRDPQQVLSRREREIVAWMRKGMTNKEIGRALGISDMTVKTHAQNIFHKLEISGRRLLGNGASAPAIDT